MRVGRERETGVRGERVGVREEREWGVRGMWGERDVV